MQLENNTLYVTKGGYIVDIRKEGRRFYATIETSPGVNDDGKSALTVRKLIPAPNSNLGWMYLSDGTILFASSWGDELKIVKKAPFSSLPTPPKGYRFKNGYAKLSQAEAGEYFLSSDGVTVIKSSDIGFASDSRFGRMLFILEKEEPIQYTELKAGDVLREGDQLSGKNKTNWKDCVVHEDKENNTIKVTDLIHCRYRRPVQEGSSWTVELEKENTKPMKTFKFKGATYRVLEPHEIIKSTDIANSRSNPLDMGWIGPNGPFVGNKADYEYLIFGRLIDSEEAQITENHVVLTDKGYKKMSYLNNEEFFKAPTTVAEIPESRKSFLKSFVGEPSKDIFNWFAERIRHALLISVVVGTTTGIIYRKEIGRALPNVSINVKLPEILQND